MIDALSYGQTSTMMKALAYQRLQQKHSLVYYFYLTAIANPFARRGDNGKSPLFDGGPYLAMDYLWLILMMCLFVHHVLFYFYFIFLVYKRFLFLICLLSRRDIKGMEPQNICTVLCKKYDNLIR